MNVVAIAVALSFSLFAVAAQGACVYPRAPETIPNGETATKEEMLSAKKAVTGYNDEITAYLSCLQLEADEQLAALEKEGGELKADADKQAFKERKEEFERRRTQKHNAAVDEVTAVVERFNEQLRAFKKRQGG